MHFESWICDYNIMIQNRTYFSHDVIDIKTDYNITEIMLLMIFFWYIDALIYDLWN